ncbi:LPXTG-motif cell wall-anchored protein [Microbacterium proteolyticum]|uniref:DUF7507 domain-containing protein n=1 Tax=Microbacterium proteolyticum TaxID=1572644 RepID=UPI00277EFA31|nr:LPXTG cell wall anchor domain-containing protein [Microbacterium proteolyticum]MDQ1168935.1 LPXTG-motif cell wall-anchored protein [Microbacterium proteolyticum]
MTSSPSEPGPASAPLFRIKPDNSVVEIGTVPPTFSAAQSAGVIYLPSGSGEIYAVQSLPTSASTAPIAVTSIASTGLYFWGASSPQDSGLCAGLALTKTVSPSASGPYVAGQTVMFTFKVENTGGLAVRDLRIIEGSFSGTGQLGTVTPATVGSLAPGATATFTAGYTLTQADVDAGSLSNTATASAQFSRRSTVTSAASTAALPIRSAPALTLDKAIAAPPGTIFAVGDTVPYRFTVENTGNVTLSGVRIVENAFSGSGTMSAVSPATVAPLAPGASAVFSASYVVTTADVAAGSVTNTATATASAPDRTLLASAPSTVAARMAVVPSPSPTAVPTPAPTNTSGSGAVPQPSTSASAGASVGRLASTGGTPALPAVMMGGGALIAGLAIVLLRRSRRMR